MKEKRDQIERIAPWQELPAEPAGPLYERLAEYIRQHIREGQFAEGARLPSKRSLAESLGLSLTTINTAYDILTAEGYLLAKPRSCYQVGPLAELYLQLPDQAEDEKSPEATAAVSRAQEKPVLYDFSINGVDESLFPERTVKRIYKKIIDAGALSTEPEARGLLSLRCELAANLWAAQGIEVNPDNIVISYGTSGLYRFLFELLPKNTIYGLEDPGFPTLRLSLERSGKNYALLPMEKDGVSAARLRQLGVEAACLTPNHQFPTGLAYSGRARQALLHWAYEADRRFLIEDDYDGMIRHTAAGESLKKLDRAGQKVLYLGSFSRSWSPGLRISYVCLPDSLSSKARRIGLPYANPVPLTEQAFLAELIRSRAFERHLNRARRLYRRKRRLLLEAIRASGLPWQLHAGPAGLHITAEPEDKQIDTRAFVKKAAEEGIKLQRLQDYAFAADCRNTLILGFGRLPETAIEPAVERLRELWEVTGHDGTR